MDGVIAMTATEAAIMRIERKLLSDTSAEGKALFADWRELLDKAGFQPFESCGQVRFRRASGEVWR